MLTSSNFPSKGEITSKFQNCKRLQGILQTGTLGMWGWKEVKKHSPPKSTPQTKKEQTPTVSHLHNYGTAKAQWDGDSKISLGSCSRI